MKTLLSIIILWIFLTFNSVALASNSNSLVRPLKELLNNYEVLDFSTMGDDSQFCGFSGSKSLLFVDEGFLEKFQGEQNSQDFEFICVAYDVISNQFSNKKTLKKSDFFDLFSSSQVLNGVDNVDSELIEYKETSQFSKPYIWLKLKDNDKENEMEGVGGIELLAFQNDESVFVTYLIYGNKSSPNADFDEIVSTIQANSSQFLVYNSKLYEVKVNSIETPKSDNAFLEPEDDQIYVALDISMTNKSKDEKGIGALNFRLQDEEGFVYKPMAFTSIKSPEFPSFIKVSPKKKVRGWITFKVQRSAENLVLEYSDFGVNFKIQLPEI
ncbi:DUF4352 domain-containing protein [Spirulina sp. CS-785/01]|uniref:DUF4352 domain-containing protein n=1 Tax=Spirulina sp. CS-785/01 TaxID=3021716 RepID=UPI00232EA479|nr:DUF4352 domain-containing protein [Spirulina sp. CS-785/01]MDB9313467.1 DUF4352 domain-containing protein [Spirulina sp. CS-785/01]